MYLLARVTSVDHSIYSQHIHIRSAIEVVRVPFLVCLTSPRIEAAVVVNWNAVAARRSAIQHAPPHERRQPALGARDGLNLTGNARFHPNNIVFYSTNAQKKPANKQTDGRSISWITHQDKAEKKGRRDRKGLRSSGPLIRARLDPSSLSHHCSI